MRNLGVVGVLGVVASASISFLSSRSTTPLFLLPLDEECLAAQGYQGGLRANCITQAMNAKKLRKK